MNVDEVRQIEDAVRRLAETWRRNETKAPNPRRADMCFGAVVALEAVLELIERVRREGPQEATGADLSASGAESDHGDRREGEGLA